MRKIISFNKIDKIIASILLMLLIIFIPSPKLAIDVNNEQLEEQQSEFGIKDFIKSSQEYGGDFFEDIDIEEILNNAIQGKVDNSTLFKKITNIFGKEIISSLKTIGSILTIIVIHSILKSISDSLENETIPKLIYYTEYILIITIIMANFSEIVNVIKETTTSMVDFMNILVPLLVTLMIYTGSIVTSGMIEPVILFMLNFVSNIIQNIIIPLVLVFTSLVIISKLSDRIQIENLSKLLKSGITGFLGIILTIFVGILSLEGTISSGVDGMTSKTTKAIVSSAIPVVGKILSDSVDTVLGCGIILKNAVGFVGIVVIIGICIMPIIKLTTITISYKLLSGIVEPIADKKIVDLLKQVGDIFKIFIAILTSLSFMLIIRYSTCFKNIK